MATVEGEVVRDAAVPAVVEGASSEAKAVVAVNPLDLPAEVFSAGLERRGNNRAALIAWVRGSLKDGVDYGRIHSVGKSRCQYARAGKASECPDKSHWSKPTLMKPGAEKICGMLGVTVSFPTLPDYEAAALAGTEIKSIILRCNLLDAAGRVVADGVGARVVEKDYGDLNKSLKMAEKSAHIDACLRMAGLSEIFTQDIEDMDLSGDGSGAVSGAASASGGGGSNGAPSGARGGSGGDQKPKPGNEADPHAAARQALNGASRRAPQATVKALVGAFRVLGVDERRLGAKLGRPVAHATEGDVETLRRCYGAIKQGRDTADSMFPAAA